MPIPLQVQLFDAFLGSQEGIHSIILPDIFSSGGSKNLWIDKYGRAKKILGYTKQNGSAVTTNTGGSATRLRHIFPYRKTSGGSFTRQILGCFDDAADEFEVFKSTNDGETWSFIQDLGSGSINSIPDFAQLGDTLIFCNGKVAPRTYDGTTWATAGSTQLGAPTAAASASSGNLVGTYKWRLVPVKSDGTRKISSAASSALTLQDKQADLSWTADADTDVVGYELYRTSGTGSVFYFVDFISGRTTVAYTDNTSDLAILENRIMQEHGDAPPQAYHCETHKQRMWYFRTDSAPQRGYWSDAGDPDSVYAENYIEFADSETLGDVIVGAVGDFEGQLVVFQERSIWTISGTGEVIGNIVDWTRVRTNAQTGAVHHRAVARVPAGSRYVDQNGKVQITDVVTLVYWTPLGDIRLFDGDNDIVISHPKKDFLATFNYAQRSKIFCVHDTPRAEVTWCFAAGTSGEPNKGVTWNYRWGIWYEREWDFAHAVEVESSSNASILLAGEADTAVGGFCYKLWNGNSFDGAAFRGQWMTKTLYGITEQALPAMSQRKRWRFADFLFETEQTVTLTVEWMQGNVPDSAAAQGSTTIQPGAFGIASAGGDTLVSAGGDSIVVSQSSTQARALLKTTAGDYLHDEGIRLRVYDESTNGSWSLEALSLAYQILPGLQRRMP